jgi:hypothetical protein
MQQAGRRLRHSLGRTPRGPEGEGALQTNQGLNRKSVLQILIK